MSTTFNKFFKGFTSYTIVIGLLSTAIYWWLPALHINNAYLIIIIFMYAITLILIWLLFKSLQGKLSSFVNAFMLVNFGKLVLYSVIIFVYAYLNRQQAVSFIITFFVFYILFTTYEILVLLKANK